MASTLYAKSGRTWSYDATGTSSVVQKYQVVLDSSPSIGSEDLPGDVTLPQVGDVHPLWDNLAVKEVQVSEGRDVDKRTLEVTVNYSPIETNTQTSGTEEAPVIYDCEDWGWDAGTEERELLEDALDGQGATHKSVLNSAGDPFDSVPKVSAYAPTFTKVMKFAERQTGAMDYNCTTNDVEITFGGQTFAEGTLLCSVSEKRLFGDANWTYQYTVNLKFRRNMVTIWGDNAPSNIGWDVAIADAGMRAWYSPGTGAPEVKRLITVIDKETGKSCTVTSPALLDGSGHTIGDTDTGGARNLLFHAYPRRIFPTWFYEEPPIEEPEAQTNANTNA